MLRNVLALVVLEWRGRRVQTAKEEVREWTQYCLVCKEWSAAFHSLPLCVVFDEVNSLPVIGKSHGRPYKMPRM